MKDNFLNVTQDLRQDSVYQFDALTTDAVNRFEICLIKSSLPQPDLVSGVNSQVSETPFLITTNSYGINIAFKSLTSLQELQIVNSQGQVVYQRESISFASIEIPINLSNVGGVYLIRIMADNQIYLSKKYLNY